MNYGDFYNEWLEEEDTYKLSKLFVYYLTMSNIKKRMNIIGYNKINLRNEMYVIDNVL